MINGNWVPVIMRLPSLAKNSFHGQALNLSVSPGVHQFDSAWHGEAYINWGRCRLLRLARLAVLRPHRVGKRDDCFTVSLNWMWGDDWDCTRLCPLLVCFCKFSYSVRSSLKFSKSRNHDPKHDINIKAAGRKHNKMTTFLSSAGWSWKINLIGVY